MGRPRRPRPARPLGLWLLTREGPWPTLAEVARAAGVTRQWLHQVARGRYGAPPGLRTAVDAVLARQDVRLPVAPWEALPPGAFREVRAEAPRRGTEPRAFRPFADGDWDEWKRRSKPMLPDECLAHFGLEADPFEDPRLEEDFWPHPQLRIVQGLVRRAVQQHGWLLVKGPAGCGKTAAVRYALGGLAGDPRRGIPRNDRYHLARLLTLRRRHVSGCSLPRALMRDLAPGARLKGSAEDLVDQVARLVATKYQAGQVCALVIEEAHELAPETWLDLKKLREITADAGGGLGVVCVGQTEGRPNLAQTLEDPDLVSVKRRVHAFELAPLTAMQARKYVDFRLGRAGARAGLVTPEAVDLLLKVLSPGGRGAGGGRLYPAALDTWLGQALVEGWSKGARVIGRDVMGFVLTTGGGAGGAEEGGAARAGADG